MEAHFSWWPYDLDGSLPSDWGGDFYIPDYEPVIQETIAYSNLGDQSKTDVNPPSI